MNSVVWLLMAACIGGMHAAPSLPPLPVNPGGIGGLFRGPNSETIIRGPDGSEITSEQIGGAVQTEPRLETIIVPDYPNDQIAVSSVTSSPSDTIPVSNNIEEVSPSFIQGNFVNPLQISTVPAAPVPQPLPIDSFVPPNSPATAEEPYIIETEVVDAPDVESNQSSDLKGPSGSISVRGSTSIVSGPASTTISEPARRIPGPQHVPVVLPAVPSTVLIPPPQPIHVDGADGFNLNSASIVSSPITLNSNLAPPHTNNEHIASSVPLYNELQSYASQQPNALGIHGESRDVEISGASSVPQSGTVTISSTQSPPELLSPKTIDLGQTIVSTTQRSTAAPSFSSGDIDVTRINLAGNNAQQNIGVSSELVSSSTMSPPRQQTSISSTSSPILCSPIQESKNNYDISNQQNRPLLTSGTHDQDFSYILNKIPESPANSNSVNAGYWLPNRSILQEQSSGSTNLVSNIPRITPDEGTRSIIPNGVPSRNLGEDSTSSSLLNSNTQSFLPSEVSSALSRSNEPIATVLDTVLVQPTDPKNREVIEFGGRQLENVGNIVPVIHHPVLLAGDLTHVHQIPTASINQLTSKNYADIYDYNRYGRQTSGKN